MVRIILFSLAFIFGGAQALAASATVDSVLNYLPLRVHPAETTGPFGFEYEARMTTDEFEVNHELGLAEDNSPYAHAAFYFMTDPSSFEDMVMYIELHVPLTNLNGNAIFDFYEYSQAVSATSTGKFSPDGPNSGAINATWNRAASNSVGTLTLNFPTLGLTFTHPFEILEYRGAYTYIRDGSALRGTNVMTRMGFPEESIHGSLNVNVASPNVINWEEGAGAWQDQDGGGITFVPLTGALERNGNAYADGLLFEDGYRPTSASDFQFAIFTLRDTRDQNNNGIPDLTDPNTNPSPSAPRLSIRVQGNALEITITGTQGASYDLESTANLSHAIWGRQLTITMPAATHEITIPRPTTPRAFWRLRVR